MIMVQNRPLINDLESLMVIDQVLIAGFRVIQMADLFSYLSLNLFPLAFLGGAKVTQHLLRIINRVG